MSAKCHKQTFSGDRSNFRFAPQSRHIRCCLAESAKCQKRTFGEDMLALRKPHSTACARSTMVEFDQLSGHRTLHTLQRYELIAVRLATRPRFREVVRVGS